jgi:acyl-CoA thioester hydrolase
MDKAGQKKFEYRVTITAKDIDELGHANNVVYLRWIQEAATAHWNHIAPAALYTRYAWVVVRHEIDYLQPAFLHDEIIAYTWVGQHAGARSERYTELYNAVTRKKLAAAKTTWCLLDAASMRPKRIEEDTHSIFE